MRKKPLISIDIITDDEAGLYKIGELDQSIDSGALKEFMIKNGVDGRNDLFARLSMLVCEVQDYFELHGFAIRSNLEAEGGNANE